MQKSKMNITEILADKTLKAKDKTEVLSTALANGTLTMDTLIAFARTAKDPVKATCMEAVEYATAATPSIANLTAFQFAIESLSAKAPRVKWESAKVIGNTARLFESHLNDAISGLLANTEDKGTVVRWSTAFALGEIIKLNTKHNT